MLITIECAWCHKALGAKECRKWEHKLAHVTHSICPSCHLKLTNKTVPLLSGTRQRKIASLGA